jgi:serine/threonine protein kinase, bacterial
VALPAGDVLEIVAAIAAALDHAHAHGLLHGDVKPANILVTTPGAGEQRILLSDFGIAPPTAAYAAPEALAGGAADAAADQYALAATAFHLLTGAPPGLRRLSGRHPALRRLDAAFARALARRPADRFATCGEFSDALHRLIASADDDSAGDVPAADAGAHALAVNPAPEVTPLSSAPEPPTTVTPDLEPPEAEGKKRSVWTLALIAAVVLVLTGLVAVGVLTGRRSAPSSPKAGPAPTRQAAAVVPSNAPTAAPPAPVEGTYRLEVQHDRQTFNYLPDSHPPNVATWWAFRTSCSGAASTACTATGIQLDDDDHTQPMPAGGGQLVLRYLDGQWQSEPATSPFSCVGPDGIPQSQTATTVLTLRPRPHGELAGEEAVTVKTNECGQRTAVIRIPTVAVRSGDLPDGVAVPDRP